MIEICADILNKKKKIFILFGKSFSLKLFFTKKKENELDFFLYFL